MILAPRSWLLPSSADALICGRVIAAPMTIVAIVIAAMTLIVAAASSLVVPIVALTDAIVVGASVAVMIHFANATVLIAGDATAEDVTVAGAISGVRIPLRHIGSILN